VYSKHIPEETICLANSDRSSLLYLPIKFIYPQHKPLVYHQCQQEQLRQHPFRC